MGARQVLIVAEQTADTRILEATVARLADRYPCAFSVLAPVRAHAGLGVGGAEAWLDATLPALSRAAGHEVVGLVGREEPLMATLDALNLLGFDQVIIWMPTARESRWLHLDLPRRLRALGVPVSQVINTAAGAGESSARR